MENLVRNYVGNLLISRDDFDRLMSITPVYHMDVTDTTNCHKITIALPPTATAAEQRRACKGIKLFLKQRP